MRTAVVTKDSSQYQRGAWIVTDMEQRLAMELFPQDGDRIIRSRTEVARFTGKTNKAVWAQLWSAGYVGPGYNIEFEESAGR